MLFLFNFYSENKVLEVNTNEIDEIKLILNRERNARKEAELIIEDKSRELFLTNNKLKSINFDLEKLVEERTYELNQKNIEITEFNEKLKSALKIRENILSGLGHELQTPLHLISGNIDLLNIELTDNNKTSYRIIQENIHNLQKIVKNITYFSDLEVGKIKPKYTKFYLSKLYDALSSAFNYINKDEKIKLEFIYQNDIQIITDYELLFHILLNIIDNSVRYSETEFIKVVVNIDEIEKNSNNLDIEVDSDNEDYIEKDTQNLKYINLNINIFDQGIGINPNILKNIFSPFVKFDGSNYYNNNGSGLGLPIVKKLANLLGGNIEIKSGINEGTTVELSYKNIKSIYENKTKNKTEKLILPEKLKIEYLKIKDTLILDDFYSFAQKLINYKNINDELYKLGIEILKYYENFDIVSLSNLSQKIDDKL